MTIFYTNGRVAWNGTSAFYDNGRVAWNGTSAFYDDGRVAWNGSSAFHDNGRVAWNGTTAFHDNGQILANNLQVQIQDINFSNLELNELEISNKVKLLTKTLTNKVYVVDLKIQLSERNAILMNRENKLTTNIIHLSKDIHLEILNRKPKLSVLGQNVINQN